jgi:hypothetical protein
MASHRVHYTDGSVLNIFGRLLYVFVWVIPRHLNFVCRCFGTFCLFHLRRRVGTNNDWAEKVGVFISRINTPTFSTRSFFVPTRLWRWNRQCSEMSAYKIQTPGSYPEENIQHSEHSESLKSRIFGRTFSFYIFQLFNNCIVMEGMSNEVAVNCFPVLP